MTYQLPQLLKFSSLRHGFSTRDSGNMSFRWGEAGEVRKSRQKFFEQLGVAPARVVTTELEHSDNIIRVSKNDADHGVLDSKYKLKADGLITDEPGIFLFHVVADCLSLLFYDEARHAVGLAHLGWQGSQVNFAQKMVERFRREFEAKLGNLKVGFGPGIHKCCYLFEYPPANTSHDWEPFLRQVNQRTAVDLVGFNVQQLIQAGVSKSNIFVSNECTAHSGKFFSHYRDKKAGAPDQGRFAAVIGINT